MKSDIVALSERLIALKTDPDNRKELHKALLLIERELKGFTIERFDKDGCKSILVHNRKQRPKRFTVLLNGHLDVIPGKDFQYKPVVKGPRLYGVGSMDMKSNVACLVAAFKDVARVVKYPLGLQIVTDEEIGGFEGTLHQIKQGVKADFVIAGEATQFDIVNQAKGVLWLKVSCKGKTAHGAYPWRGCNAILEMNAALEELLQRFPIPQSQEWVSTVNVSRVETTNASFNKVPDDCSAMLDIRFVPKDAKRILQKVKAAFPKGFTFEVLAQEPALNVPESNHFLQALKACTEEVTGKEVSFYGAQGSSDARHFTRIGCAGVEFGPIGKGIGTDNEWVSIPSLKKYRAILNRFLLSL